MKKIIIGIITLLFCFSYSQKGLVEYGYIESLGIGDAKGLDYNAILLFDKDNSHFITCKSSLETPEKINGTKVIEKDGQVVAIMNGINVSENGNQVYFSNSSKKMFSTFNYQGMVYINDGETNIVWNTTNETKKIGTFICNKATTSFRGRDYTAWFTLKIPVSFGPWKLNGLPGLILEAYDTDKNVYWYFKNLVYPSLKKESIQTISEIEYKNYQEYSSFKLFLGNIRKKIEDKNIILSKKYPSITAETPKMNEMFVECE